MASTREKLNDINRRMPSALDLLCVACLINHEQLPSELFIGVFENEIVNELARVGLVNVNADKQYISLDENVKIELVAFIQDDADEERINQFDEQRKTKVTSHIIKVIEEIISLTAKNSFTEKHALYIQYGESIVESAEKIGIDRNLIHQLTLFIADHFKNQIQLQQARQYYILAKSQLAEFQFDTSPTAQLEYISEMLKRIDKILPQKVHSKAESNAGISANRKNSQVKPITYGVASAVLLTGAGYLLWQNREKLSANLCQRPAFNFKFT